MSCSPQAVLLAVMLNFQFAAPTEERFATDALRFLRRWGVNSGNAFGFSVAREVCDAYRAGFDHGDMFALGSV